MNEKRRSKRMDVDLELKVSTLFNQDNVRISNVDLPIEVKNVSKGGVGFESQSILPEGYYFNAALRLGKDSDILYCVIKIIRCTAKENGIYDYGAQFVGMAPILYYIFDEYEEELSHHESD